MGLLGHKQTNDIDLKKKYFIYNKQVHFKILSKKKYISLIF